MSEVEARAPMAKVTRHDEDCLFVLEKRQKQFGVCMVFAVWDLSNHQWDKFYICLSRILEALLDIGQVKL